MKKNPKNRLFTRSSILGASLPAIFTVVLAASAHAATATWDGATNTNWNADNWAGGAGTGGAPVANDILSFSGNGGTAGPTTVNNFAAATQFGSGTGSAILFTNNGTGGASNTAFSLSGASITLGGNINASSSTAAIQDTISNDLLIGASRVVTAAGNHTIALTGNITINTTIGAVLNFNNAAALSGAGGAINLNVTNATLTYSNITTATSLALSRAINANAGALLNNTSTNAAATIIYNGTFTGTANTFVLTGTNLGANDFQSAIGAGAATILLKAGTGSWTMSGLMSSTAGTGVSGVTGNLTLSNDNNSYTGQTIVSGGTLHIATIADFGTNSAVGKGTSGTALRLGNAATSGILNYTGAGSSSNRTIQIGGGTAGTDTGTATIQNNGSNGGTGLKFTAATSSTAFNTPVASTTANRTLTLGGTNTDANEIQGRIADNTASTGLVAVTKAGNGKWTLSGTNTYSSATLINAGILQLGNGSTTGALTGTSGITNNSTLIVNRSNSFTQLTDLNNKAITGTGSFTQAGAGTTTLSGTNTYTGVTLITAGTLKLDVTGTINNTSEVSLGTVGTFDVSAKSGYAVGTLKGSGNVTGALTVSTTLAIGNSPGTTNFSSNLTLDSASYIYEMTGGVAPGIGSADLGNVANNLTISAGSILDLVELGTYTAGNKFTLFGYSTLVGTFDGLANNATFFDDLANTWLIKYDDMTSGANGGTGTNFVTITAIPEPNVAALLGGLGVLLILRRRR